MSRRKKDQAAKDKKPFDPFIESTAQKQIEVNQTAKVRAGADINAARERLKTAHPK